MCKRWEAYACYLLEVMKISPEDARKMSVGEFQTGFAPSLSAAEISPGQSNHLVGLRVVTVRRVAAK